MGGEVRDPSRGDVADSLGGYRPTAGEHTRDAEHEDRPPSLYPLEGKVVEELQEVALQDFPKGMLIPMHIRRWLVEKIPAFDKVNPDLLFCLYDRGGKKGDLERTRRVIQNHRVKMVVGSLLAWVRDGTIKIPLDVVKDLKADHPTVRFRGNTVRGPNQALVYLLRIADASGRLEGKLRAENPIVSAVQLWKMSATGSSVEWAEKCKEHSEAGTCSLLTNLL